MDYITKIAILYEDNFHSKNETNYINKTIEFYCDRLITEIEFINFIKGIEVDYVLKNFDGYNALTTSILYGYHNTNINNVAKFLMDTCIVDINIIINDNGFNLLFLSIDIENNYKPTYIISKDKHKIVNDLKETAKKCDSVILAADNDREGEAIAWSLSNLLNLKNPPRIIFTEITKKAIENAIKNPIQINMDIVHAQQTRRLLDRLVGYKISPILQKNLNDKEAKSAGRVQSVLIKIIKDKEDETNNAISNLYLKTSCELEFEGTKINCNLVKNNEIYKFDSLENAKKFIELINKNTIFKVINIQEKISIRKPSPPFITSSLQQEASTKLKFSVKKTMDVAKKLYEGGHITYMRTDSPNLSQDAINSCKKYIIDTYGEQYSKPTNYSATGGAQEAHEAIRPSYINNINIDSSDKDQLKLYNLISNEKQNSLTTSYSILLSTLLP